MSSQEFLQDFVEEVQEHLADMEKSLLVLEREGADQEHIAHVFRAAHSIKGASTYMGFEGLAALTHELESLIAAIQQNSGAIPSNGIGILLKCVDVMSGAVEHVKREGVEPPMDPSFLETIRTAFSTEETPASVLSEIDADPAASALLPGEEEFESPLQEEDEELMGIFIGSIRENYAKLRDLLESFPPSPTENDSREAQELIRKMAASAQYMDYQPVSSRFEELEEMFTAAGGREMLERLEATAERLDRMIPGLEISQPSQPADIPAEAPLEEEDQELFSIFLSAFQQNFTDLAQTLFSSAPAPERFEKASALTDSMIRSSQYMDYEQIVALLGGWEESLAIAKTGEDGNLRKRLMELAQILRTLLPGFRVPELSETTPEEPSLDFLDDAMDSFFDMAEQPPETGTASENTEPGGPFAEPAKEMAPVAARQERNIPAAHRQEEPARSAAGKERTVLVAEDVQHNAATLRVDAQKVDQLLNQVGELVVNRSEFVQTSTLFRDILRDLSTRGVLPKEELRRLRLLNFRLNESTQSLGRVANDLQSSVMRVRMLPIYQLFQRFPRIVRDQALKFGKKVELMIEGGETEIDKRVLEQMNDPLVQFLRNAIVHGLESPEERRLAGKPDTGIIRLAAYHSGEYVTIEVEDDGRGVNTQKLRELLHSRSELSGHEVDKLSDREVAYAMFMPGVSTYDRVDGAAGRGVGLDVVKENVERMNGSIEVEFEPGRGTRFIVRIPLTVAIIRALLVREAGQIFTIPLTSVSEILRYRPEASHSIEGFRVITLRGKTIPLVDLRKLLKMGSGNMDGGRRFVVIVSTSFREVGLVVDALLGEREVVIKSIENAFHSIEGFSGATILGDGRVSLIVDVSALLRMMKNSAALTRQTAHATLH